MLKSKEKIQIISKYSYSDCKYKYIAMIVKVYEYTSVLLLYFFPFCHFTKGKIFFDFEFATLDKETLPKRCLFLGRFAYCEAGFLKLIPDEKGDYNENGICFL